jgi:hypothetical protein
MERYISIKDAYVPLLSEAVQRPHNYLKLIEGKLEKYKKYFLKQNNGIDILFKLSSIFKKNNIKFIADEKNFHYNYFGINGASTSPDIFRTIEVYCYPKAILDLSKNEKNFDLFVKILLNYLGHEFVHRMQTVDIKNEELLKKLFSTNLKNKQKYLSKKLEIMGYAWTIIEEFRFMGYTDKEILNVMRTPKSIKSIGRTEPSVYKEYKKLFYDNDEILNRLHKYMYEYIDWTY